MNAKRQCYRMIYQPIRTFKTFYKVVKKWLQYKINMYLKCPYVLLAEY